MFSFDKHLLQNIYCPFSFLAGEADFVFKAMC